MTPLERSSMTERRAQPITQMLHAWEKGDPKALEQVMDAAYGELHRLAHRFMAREHPGHTLQTSALVNEAYLRLMRQKNSQWQNRAHFFGIAARMMRRILVDHARSQMFAKRGGGALHVSLSEADGRTDNKTADVLALDEALSELERMDAQQSRIVEARFFGGLTINETAEVLSISVDSVKRDWSTAKAWLYRELEK
jgi:RNA polymerase sigma factor (TIGR02999 family)